MICLAFALSKMLYILEASYAQFIKQEITLQRKVIRSNDSTQS